MVVCSLQMGIANFILLMSQCHLDLYDRAWGSTDPGPKSEGFGQNCLRIESNSCHINGFQAPSFSQISAIPPNKKILGLR